MKTFCRQAMRGFTLVELLVVVAIIAIMLSLAGNMMRGAGKGQGLQAAVQQLQDMVQEARLEATSKSTWSRLVVVSDPMDDSPNTQNLRYMAVMVKKPERTVDQRSKIGGGQWEILARGRYLPAGFFISPKYSTLLPVTTTREDRVGRKSSTFAQLLDKMRLSNKGEEDVFFIEFDPQGRMSEPSYPTRLVVIGALPDRGVGGDDAGIRPSPVEARTKLPQIAAGIVIWPKGNTSLLRTREQIFGVTPNVSR